MADLEDEGHRSTFAAQAPVDRENSSALATTSLCTRRPYLRTCGTGRQLRRSLKVNNNSIEAACFVVKILYLIG